MEIEANGINDAGGGPMLGEDVIQCEQWMRDHCHKTKRINASWSSMYIKRLIEDQLGILSVQHGAVIRAAKNLGYDFIPTEEGSHKVSFNFSFRA